MGKGMESNGMGILSMGIHQLTEGPKGGGNDRAGIVCVGGE
jgi:hypothetical protein